MEIRRRKNEPLTPTPSSTARTTADAAAGGSLNSDAHRSSRTNSGDQQRHNNSERHSINNQPQRKSLEAVAADIVDIVLSLACVAFVAWGVYLCFTRLYTQEECDMTWSHREFIHIELTSSTTTTAPYRLHKFVDRRDMRQQRLLSLSQPLQEKDGWCYGDGSSSSSSSTLSNNNNNNNTTVAVLYIPGHGGSYQQSRSLGAHSIQLTRRQITRKQLDIIQRALSDGQWTGTTAKEESKFVYDVYAVDFREEPSGLHGQFVLEQAKFVSEVVQHLSRTCGFNQIFIVAHSIGGYAARLAASNPEVSSLIRNLITLGTPHSHPVLAWEKQLHQVHGNLTTASSTNSNNNLAIVSISGGLRDEIIPPALCQVNNYHDPTISPTTINLMASDIMVKPIDDQKVMPALGMDHKTIVWCNNLLAPVRVILYALVRADYPSLSSSTTMASDRIRAVRESLSLINDDNDNGTAAATSSYEKALRRQHDTLKEVYGFWTAFGMETSLLYNTEWLVSQYATIGIWGYILNICEWPRLVQTFVVLFIASSQYWLETTQYQEDSTQPRPSFPGILLITIVANVIYSMFHDVLLRRTMQARLVRYRRQCCFVAAFVTVASLVGSLLPANQTDVSDPHWWLLIQPHVILGLVSIAGTLILGFLLVSTLPPPATSSTAASNNNFFASGTTSSLTPSHLWSNRLTRLMALLLPLLPFVFGGDLALLLYRGRVYPSLWLVTSPFVIWVAAKHFLMVPSVHLYGSKIPPVVWLLGTVLQVLRLVLFIPGSNTFFAFAPLYDADGHRHSPGISNALYALLFLDLIEVVLPSLFLAKGGQEQA